MEQYERVVAKYPGELDKLRREVCLGEVQTFLPKGRYQDKDGKLVYLERIQFREGRYRAMDIVVSFHYENGDEVLELPLGFFIPIHQFRWVDAASL